MGNFIKYFFRKVAILIMHIFVGKIPNLSSKSGRGREPRFVLKAYNGARGFPEKSFKINGFHAGWRCWLGNYFKNPVNYDAYECGGGRLLY